MSKNLHRVRGLLTAGMLLAALLSGQATAQEVRYSWLDVSFMAQDIDLMGSLDTPAPDQFVDLHAKDGDGVRFRGSVGTWNNLYLFVDYGSTDIDVDVVITNPGGSFPGVDEFDYTDIRGGVGVKWSIAFSTDLYAEVSYDSVDFDFASFAGENFDTGQSDVGGALGVRSMVTDNLELRAYGRYTPNAEVDLTTAVYDSGSLFGAGFGWEIVNGLSIVGDYESGEFARWSVGFRLDLDED
jgi:hypothetical protein